MIFRVVMVIASSLTICGVAEARCTDPWCAMCARSYGAPSGYTLLDGPGYGYVVQNPVIDSSRPEVVAAIMREAKLTEYDLLYDLGCGDGRILIAAVEASGCQAVGIEIHGTTAMVARQNVKDAGCGRIRVVDGDARNFKLDKATVVVMYLSEKLVAQLAPRISPRARIISSSHPVPGRKNRKVLVDGKHPIYVCEPKRKISEVTAPCRHWERAIHASLISCR